MMGPPHNKGTPTQYKGKSASPLSHDTGGRACEGEASVFVCVCVALCDALVGLCCQPPFLVTKVNSKIVMYLFLTLPIKHNK